jgi:hypothetical protein
MEERKGETKEERKRRLTKNRLARYYQNHKEDILEKNKTPVNCKYCGRKVKKGVLYKHQNTVSCKNAYEFLKKNYNIDCNNNKNIIEKETNNKLVC